MLQRLEVECGGGGTYLNSLRLISRLIGQLESSYLTPKSRNSTMVVDRLNDHVKTKREPKSKGIHETTIEKRAAYIHTRSVLIAASRRKVHLKHFTSVPSVYAEMDGRKDGEAVAPLQASMHKDNKTSLKLG